MSHLGPQTQTLAFLGRKVRLYSRVCCVAISRRCDQNLAGPLAYDGCEKVVFLGTNPLINPWSSGLTLLDGCFMVRKLANVDLL